MKTLDLLEFHLFTARCQNCKLSGGMWEQNVVVPQHAPVSCHRSQPLNAALSGLSALTLVAYVGRGGGVCVHCNFNQLARTLSLKRKPFYLCTVQDLTWKAIQEEEKDAGGCFPGPGKCFKNFTACRSTMNSYKLKTY